MPTDRSGLRTTTPTRTCIGCRRPDSWSALVRVVATRQDPGPALVVPDPRRRLPGRGAWLHPVTDCFEYAVRRRAFGRALRLQAPPDTSALAAYLLAHSSETPEVRHPEGGFER